MSNVTAYMGTATIGVDKNTSTGAMERGPSTLAANWLALVEQRLRDSIVTEDAQNPQSGQWLTANVANNALRFFEMTSNFLPGEPFIYSSNGSDLIAEFKARNGIMTGVVTGTGLLVFATVKGVAQAEKHIDLLTASPNTLQTELKPLALQLTAAE